MTAAELERAKVRTEVARVSALKSNMGLAMMIGEAVRVSGGTAYVREYEERINAVTAAQVQDVAKRYLGASRKNVIELRKTAGAAKPSRGGDAADKRGGGEAKRGQKHSPGFAQAMKEIESAKKLEFRIPAVGKEVERVVLPSGVTVFIKEDHSAPSVEMSFQWLGGSNTTPVAELAPFELAGDLLTNGGTGTLDPVALDERKEDLGMTVGLWMGTTGSGASFWSLRRNFPAAFELAADVIMRPRLDAERLTTIKGQYVESMRRRYESPAEGSALIQEEVLDGDHPRLGWVASREQIESLTPDQIRAIWEKYAGRDNLFVTVVGDFDRKETLKRIDAAFASWRKAQDDKRVWITRDPVVRPGTFVVEKELPQLSVRFAEQLKLDRTASTDDHAAIEVMNSILGGSGFRSRLMERLRTDEGLTYGVRSTLEHEGRPGVPGMLGIAYQTKQESVGRSVEIVMQELNRIVDQDVSEAEVAEQIDAWRNRFVFRFTNDFSIVNRLMSNELDDQPYDKDSRDLAAVQKVTVKDVRRVAQKYLKPANVTLSLYGSPTEADRAALEKRLGLKVLKREQVFKGGYDAAPPAAPSPAKP